MRTVAGAARLRISKALRASRKRRRAACRLSDVRPPLPFGRVRSAPDPCHHRLVRSASACLAAFALLATAAASRRWPPSPHASSSPARPGEPSREITAAEATDTSGVRHRAADVRFMQGMIGHHAQAVEMVALVATRTASEGLRRLALRIEVSQKRRDADDARVADASRRAPAGPARAPHGARADAGHADGRADGAAGGRAGARRSTGCSSRA